MTKSYLNTRRKSPPSRFPPTTDDFFNLKRPRPSGDRSVQHTMFKKRTRPSSIRSKDTAPSLPASSTAALPSTSSSATSPLPSESTLTDAHNSADLPTPTSAAVPTEEEDEPSVGATIQDLLSLRRLRRQAEGLDLEKLNRGEVRKRKKKAVAAEGEEEAEEEGEGGEEQSQVGLRAGKGKGREEIDECVQSPPCWAYEGG
jgi:hypothetical protein